VSTARRVPLRCPSKHWGYAIDAVGTQEVRCRGQYCKTTTGGTVIHAFDLATGSFGTRVEADTSQAIGPEEHHHARNTAV
jgi:hypothetical protein